MSGREQISRDVVVGFFDIETACADVANAEPQEALDAFYAGVHRFVTDGQRLTGDLTRDEATEVLDRAISLATYATYHYGKLVGTAAAAMGEPTVNLIRNARQSVTLGILEEDTDLEPPC